VEDFLAAFRRPLALILILFLFATFSGIVAAVVLQHFFGVEGDLLLMWVGLATAAGAAVGQMFGGPLFSAWLERRLALKVPPPPGPAETKRWMSPLRNAVVQRRVLGQKSQREQMLGGRPLIDLPLAPDLDIRSSTSGKPVLRWSGEGGPLSQVVGEWKKSRGRLVILGEPGFGKTFAALALIGGINKDESRQVAELFPMVDWHFWTKAHPDSSIEDWLAHELTQTYPEVPLSIAAALVSEGRLVPVFDGLDEVPAADRARCRDALEAFAGREEPHRSFVVTCRRDEYLELSPKWVGADRQVLLTRLSAPAIAEALRAGTAPSPGWAKVIETIDREEDSYLLFLLGSPLRLAAAIEVFESRDPGDLIQLAKNPDAHEELWDLLLNTGDHAYEGHDPGEIRGWLSFIAASMRVHGRQRFWLHELHLYGAPKDRHIFLLGGTVLLFGLPVWVPALTARTIAGSLLAVVFGFWILLFYLWRRDMPPTIVMRHRRSVLSYVRGIPHSLKTTFLAALIWMTIICPLIFAILALAVTLEGYSVDPQGAALEALRVAALSGATVGALWFAFSLDSGGSSSDPDELPDHLVGRGPGAVVKAARDHGLFATCFSGILFATVDFLVLPLSHPAESLCIGIFLFAWISGLEGWAFYHWTRWRLARSGHLPLRLRNFLDWAAEDTGLLRASDSYEFRHRELLDYLAREGAPVGAANVNVRAYAGGRPPKQLAGNAVEPPRAEAQRLRRSDIEQHRGNIALAQEAVDLRPDDARAHADLGLARYHAGDPASALPALRRAAALDPRDFRNHADLALVLSTLGADEEARRILDAALEGDLEEVEPLLNRRAWVLRSLRSREREVETAEDLTSASPNEAMAWWRLSTAMLQAARPAEAANARRKAVELAKRAAPRSLHALGWELNSTGYSTDAATVGKHLRPTARGHQGSAILAHALADLGEEERSDAYLQPLEAAAAKAGTLNTLANVMIVRGRWRAAEAAAEQATKQKADEITYAFTRAEARLASGNLAALPELLTPALDRARVAGFPPGDPAWLCRILWQYCAAPDRDAAVEIVIDAYTRRVVLGVGPPRRVPRRRRNHPEPELVS
jgi:tetratricopeptide (TPR) repeat protein